MVKLALDELKKRSEWAAAGIAIPTFEIQKMRAETKANPTWVHMGAGNIFRGFLADLADKLLESGDMKSGISVITPHDTEVISKIYAPYDGLVLRVTMAADGTLTKNVVGSIGEYMRGDRNLPEEWNRCVEIFRSPSLQMVSFTITEKGYKIKDLSGKYYPSVEEIFKDASPDKISGNAMALVSVLLLERFRAGAMPVAMVSMDNFSHNGDKLFDAVRTFAEKWAENGAVPKEFVDYICGPKVSFPWSMIDKITPRPDASVSRMLKESGFESADLIVTSKNTYIAPFVNAEKPQYLVVEDKFPNGRPPLEKVGVRFTTRETVDLVERMKVCTCLNPLHTAMAVFGCLLGFSSIAAEMKDESIVRLVKRIGYVEGMPVVSDPKIFVPAEFIAEVLSERLPNPYIPDTPQRIATDTSQKLSIRYGETIKHYLAREDLDVRSLEAIPLTIAAWCRYLLALDDAGSPMKLSPDPLLDELCGYLAPVKLGDPESAGDCLRPVLSNASVFGSDLYAVGLADKITAYFKKLLAGPGAVRKTLDEVTSAPSFIPADLA